MAKTIEDGDFRRLSADIIKKVYDNVLELDLINDTLRVEKAGGITRSFSAIPVRFFLDDALRFIEERFTFDEDGLLRSFTENARDHFGEVRRFTAVSKKDGQICRGLLVSGGSVCRIGFSADGENTAAIPVQPSGQPRVYIRTRGYFEVTKNGETVLFHSKKAKELLALLADRNGGYVSSQDAAAILWKGQTATPQLFSRYRKVAMRLKETLEENGIGFIVENVSGNRRIVPAMITSDLHEAAGNEPYLPEYPWADHGKKYREN